MELDLILEPDLTPGEVRELLNRESGLLGLAESGSNDLRDILEAEQRGNRRAAVAVDAFCYRVRKYIGSYWAALGGLDVLIFTGGIGEKSPEIRRRICDPLGGDSDAGIPLDPTGNESAETGVREIGSTESPVRILVIPTDEEQAIARQTFALIENTPMATTNNPDGMAQDSPE